MGQERFNPSKHFLFSKTSWWLLEDVYSVILFHLPRHLQDQFARHLPKTFLRSLQDIFKTSSQDVLQTSLSRTGMLSSSRRLQDILQTKRKCLATMPCRRLEDDLEDKKKLHWKCLQCIFTKTNVSPDFNTPTAQYRERITISTIYSLRNTFFCEK